eukprot:CAMPEP_0194591424 /NCGR_PEP_ID=MMETSP0292-20121207/22069_1 /TAXON_ID=39354 /ORGANISM="Heterosigma akashiwo, Strain CCMP2393" /LENGTH=108 /DNA_ID=CAMNT_0039449519 /DNA_START=569 /DNA_END=892 /DNA_ORIENTATION=+
MPGHFRLSNAQVVVARAHQGLQVVLLALAQNKGHLQVSEVHAVEDVHRPPGMGLLRGAQEALAPLLHQAEEELDELLRAAVGQEREQGHDRGRQRGDLAAAAAARRRR